MDSVRFEFVPSANNVVVQATRTATTGPFTRGYSDITAFTGGDPNLATQGSTGIIITRAGIYSIDTQIDIEIRADPDTAPPGSPLRGISEWGVLLFLERSDGTLIDSYAFHAEAYSSVFRGDTTYPIHGGVDARELPANTRVYFKLFYLRTDHDETQVLTETLNYRVVTPSEDDDRVVINRYSSTAQPGTPGFGYQNFYIASTANTVAQPNIDYDGTNFSQFAPWAMTVPTTPTGANIFEMPVRYQEGVARSETEEGIILVGRVPGATPPPAGSTTYSDGVEYGNAIGNTPATKLGDVNDFSLSIGESHTTEQITMRTTDTNVNYYIRLASGLRLTGATESVDGDEFDNWNRVGNTQVYIYQIGFRSVNSFTFTVRRDN